MIDWHCHILPQMDDGSRSVEESIALLNMQSKQNIDVVMATPHFYANDETVESFLTRRRKSFELLEMNLPENAPHIRLGAEVYYYPGISRLSGFEDLKAEGSSVLLLEMPMSRWSEYTVRELIELSAMSGVELVLAHIERYLRLQSHSLWEELFDKQILMQINASFLNSLGTRHRALSLLREGKVQFVGSDCHNLTSRPPQIGKAFEIIQKKLGEDYLVQMNEYGRSVLNINH